ncbi:hypothetical protein C7449_1193 [Mycoplana dimorpha]|uniref:Uncharacterized protein n=1 Tax=Mycoplana dimorpha TaxID=28320 RepID=A0A2T5AHH1_MYCDI|nr:hypothetical protein C7449_1193 [Mycoplana dimorpha]
MLQWQKLQMRQHSGLWFGLLISGQSEPIFLIVGTVMEFSVCSQFSKYPSAMRLGVVSSKVGGEAALPGWISDPMV